MSIATNETEVYLKLKEAEFEAEHTEKRYEHEEVISKLKALLKDSTSAKD